MRSSWTIHRPPFFRQARSDAKSRAVYFAPSRSWSRTFPGSFTSSTQTIDLSAHKKATSFGCCATRWSRATSGQGTVVLDQQVTRDEIRPKRELLLVWEQTPSV